MEMTIQNPSVNKIESTDLRTRRIPWGMIGLLMILIGYGIFLLSRFSPAIAEPDANGYWAQGSLMVQTGQTWFKPQSDAQYIGMHWLLTPSGIFVSRYPPGLPLVIGIVYATLGYKASVLVNPILALAALAGLYFAARQIMSAGWALAAVVLLAMNPTFAQHALASDSHMAVAACVVWGIYFLLAWSSQGKIRQIIAAGLVLGSIVTVRYPDAIMGAAVLTFLLMHWRRPKFWRDFSLAGISAAVPIVPLLVRNQLLLGAFWKTGYSLTNEETGFSWAYFQQHWLQYLQEINGDALGLMFALGVVGITLMICLRRNRPLGLMLSLMTVPMVLLYMAYYWAPAGMASGTLRFLVPTLPCFILAGVWLLDEVTIAAPTAARIALPLVVVLMQLAWGGSETFGQTAQIKYSKDVLTKVTDALDEVTQKGDVIIASDQIEQHLDFVRHWKIADISLAGGSLGGRGALGAPGRAGQGGMFGNNPDTPSPMQAEKQKVLRALYQGSNPQQRFTSDLVDWADGQKIYLVGTESQVRLAANQFSPASKIQIVKRVQLPAAPAPPETNGRGGRGGFDGGMGRGNGPMGVRGGNRMGGPMGMMMFEGETELVVAQWILPSKR